MAIYSFTQIEAARIPITSQLNSTKAETYTVNAGETTTVIFTVIK